MRVQSISRVQYHVTDKSHQYLVSCRKPHGANPKNKRKKKEKQHENRWAPVQQQTMDPNPPQDMETGHDQQVLAIKHKSSILD